MEDIATLAELFDDAEEASVVEPTEAPEAPEVETPTEEVEQVMGEEGDTPPVSEPEKPPEGYVPQAALADERGKRQDLQRQIDELTGRLTQVAQPKEETPEPEKVDFLDDPDKWAEQREAAMQAQIAEVRLESSRMALNALEVAAKARHEDYDEMAQEFLKVAMENPALQKKAAEAPDPAEFVYQTGIRLAKINSAGGDIDALIQREREAAVAEYLKANPTPASRAVDVPTSLSTVTGAATRQEAFSPPSLEELLD